MGHVTMVCSKCPQDCPCLREGVHVVCVCFFPRKAILSYTKRKPPIDFYFKELSKSSEIDKKRDIVFTKPPQMMLTFINSVYVGKNTAFGVLLYRWALVAQKYDFLLAPSHCTTF